MSLGYGSGQPFGDPSQFTRSTGEDEINRFNQWMRSQPWWQQIRGHGTGDFTESQQRQLVAAAAANGVTLPGAFHIDEGGNINQKSRTKRNLLIAALAGGAAVTGGLALTGAFAGAPAGAAAGGASGFGAGVGPLASGIPTAAPGLMGGATLGSAGAAGGAAAGGAAALGAGGGGAGTAGATVAGTSGVHKAIDYLKTGLAGTALVGGLTHQNSNPWSANGGIPPELQQMLDLQRQRMQMQQPLYEAVTRMAYNRLPTNLAQGDGTDPISLAMKQMTGGK